VQARHSIVALSVLVALSGCEVGRNNRDGGAGADARVIQCDTISDADGDGIYDDFETSFDSDGDGAGNYQDTDSDGDGFSDADEHGTDDGCSARDQDTDGYFDYLDLDRDGDGLSDAEERDRYFTDPSDDDSDDDGFTDLAEVATGHDPNDATDGIPEDAYYVVLPYMGDAVERELVFGTTVRKADVFFMVDSTGSMSGAISNLTAGIRGTLVPELRAALTDVGIGFGQFAGFGGVACTSVLGIPSCADGPPGDNPFELVQTITTNDSEMESAVARLNADSGGANWASSNEALYQAATGDGILPWVPQQTCTSVPDEVGMRHGYPCFRPGALPIMVVITDTASKNGPGAPTYDNSQFTGAVPHTHEQTLEGLRGIGARVIGVISDDVQEGSPHLQFQTWARETGTVDATGTPLQFGMRANGSGLDSSIVEAIRTLAEETPQDISAIVRDGEDRPEGVGPVDANVFVKAITPVSVFDGAVAHSCPDAARCDDRHFFDVTPGSRVTFRIRFLNDTQEPRSHAQVFLATIIVLGNGVAELDAREVIIVVPSGSVPLLI